ncbi:DUF6663 family protein [Halostella sp. PRR32]|uniref:DUF6663 family protein n=1 Tax=Halostella sp. PRR32 TaxID=3098147 RepID=UPI002B1D412C|nr:DUF6663 family protein [Halostella sp. PRR32]
MQPRTSGRFRVLEGTREGDEWLFLDVDTMDPTYVTKTGHGDAQSAVDELEPGYRIDATIAWEDETPRVADIDVLDRTVIEFVDGADTVFDAAQETWRDARADGAGMNADVTYSTDGEANGVVYTFAEQGGERDLFGEFRDGMRPLEPLIDRLADGEERPFEVFVIRPAADPFVIVYLTIEKGGLLADTVRDTYDCPRTE